MNKFELSPVFTIGHETIDAEHRELVKILNEMIDVLSNEDLKACKELNTLLFQKIDFHFQHENEIMNELKYQQNEEQLARTKLGLLNLSKSANECCSLIDWEKKIGEISYFLFTFILKNDLHFAEYLISIGYAKRERNYLMELGLNQKYRNL